MLRVPKHGSTRVLWSGVINMRQLIGSLQTWSVVEMSYNDEFIEILQKKDMLHTLIFKAYCFVIR